jgi:hypothetical protein
MFSLCVCPLQAEEENLLFAPVPGKTQEGHQVYRLGKSMVYVDRNVMFLQETNMRWVPASLQTVIDKAKGSGSDR